MKPMLRICTALWLAFGWTATNASPVLIDFEDLSSGTLLTDQYAALGVTFAAFDTGSEIESTAYPTRVDTADRPYAGNYFNSSLSGAANDGYYRIRIAFSAPVWDVSWLTRTEVFVPTPGVFVPSQDGYSVITINAYGINGRYEGLQEVQSVGGNWQQTTLSLGGIQWIDILAPDAGTAWALDNLRFSIALGDTGSGASYSVPEPGAIGLLLMGVVGAGLAKRRRSVSARSS